MGRPFLCSMYRREVCFALRGEDGLRRPTFAVRCKTRWMLRRHSRRSIRCAYTA